MLGAVASYRIVWQQGKGNSLLIALFYMKWTLGSRMAARAAGSMLPNLRWVTF